MHFLCQILKALRFAVLIHYFTTKHIDLTLVLFILWLCRVEAQLLLTNCVLLAAQLDVVSLVGYTDCTKLDLNYFLWRNLFDVFFPLGQFIFDLLDLVLQDLEPSLLVLKLLRVGVDLTLQPHRLTLVDGVVAASHWTVCSRSHFLSWLTKLFKFLNSNY